MPLTREQGQTALDHVVGTVLDSPATSPLAKALAHRGIKDIRDLILLDRADIDALEYEDDGTIHLVPLGYQVRLRAFMFFIEHRTLSGNPINLAWTAITQDEFDEYRVSPEFADVRDGATRPSATSPPTGTTSVPSTRDLVTEFCKGIKRDTSQFSSLKDEKQWDQWQRSTMAQARAQGIAEVLDPTYKPTTDTGKALFAKKNKIMYAVFERTLLTDTGKTAVRQHEGDSDAQAVWKEVVEYYTDSIKTSILHHLRSCR